MKKWLSIIAGMMVCVMVCSIGVYLLSANKDKTPDNEPTQPQEYPVTGPENETGESYFSCFDSFTDVVVTDEESALRAVADVAQQIGISNVEQELQITRVDQVNDTTYYRMQQYYDGLAVEGREVVLAASDSGEATALTANTIGTDYPSKEGTVNKNIAEQIAIDYVEYLNSEVIDTKTCYFLDENEGVHLSYLVKINSSGMLVDVYVDANTAEVLKYNDNTDWDTCYNADGTVSFEGAYDEILGEYQVINEKNSIIIGNLMMNNSKTNLGSMELISSKDAYFGNTLEEQELEPEKAIQLLHNMVLIREFFNSEFQAYADGEIYCAYNDSWYAGDNGWAGERGINGKNVGVICIGYIKSVDEIDLLGHEYTHRVITNIVDFDSDGHAGAIHEGYADLFGEIVEDYSIDGVLDGDCNWVHGKRNLSNPSAKGYPKKVTDENYTFQDYSHAYSTVASHAAYLMHKGVDGKTESGLDVDMLAKLWFEALHLYHTNTNFYQMADTLVNLADQWNQRGILTDEQLDSVYYALDEVGILTEKVGSTFKVSVFGNDKARYDKYHLQVVRLRDEMVVKDMEVSVADAQEMKLPQGYYSIIVSDNSETGSSHIFSKIIYVTPFHFSKTEVSLFTDFGVMDQDTIYGEYRRIIQEYESTYGELCGYSWDPQDNFWWCLGGVCYLELVDFDGNGTEELLIAYDTDLDKYENIYMDVWGVKEGRIEKLFSRRANMSEQAGKFYISLECKNGQTLINIDAFDTRHDVMYWCDYSYALSNQEFTVVKMFGYEFLEGPDEGTGAPYYVDEEEVSQEEFYEELALWQEEYEYREVWFSNYTMEESLLPDTFSQQINAVKEKLGLV